MENMKLEHDATIREYQQQLEDLRTRVSAVVSGMLARSMSDADAVEAVRALGCEIEYIEAAPRCVVPQRVFNDTGTHTYHHASPPLNPCLPPLRSVVKEAASSTSTTAPTTPSPSPKPSIAWTGQVWCSAKARAGVVAAQLHRAVCGPVCERGGGRGACGTAHQPCFGLVMMHDRLLRMVFGRSIMPSWCLRELQCCMGGVRHSVSPLAGLCFDDDTCGADVAAVGGPPAH